MSGNQTAILLVNLGTPDAPTPTAVKQYLKEFLADPRVISIWPPLWWCILNGVVLPIRSKKSAAKYQKIWTQEGSPLLVNSEKQAAALQNKCEDKKVYLAMRYGKPSIPEVLNEIKKDNPKKIIILPLYPQFSASTTLSVFEAVMAEFKSWSFVPDLQFVSHFADHAAYTFALAHHISTFWEKNGRGEKILFSFHGLPEASISKGDPYREQCYLTATHLAEKLNLKKEEYQVVFQSRFGYQTWLKPYCIDTLTELAKENIKKIDVVCPGFVADCLETLEEIAIVNKNHFLKAGGEQLHYIPALNDSPLFIDALKEITR